MGQLFGLGLLALLVIVPASTAKSLPPLALTIEDLTPKFLAFYDAAVGEHASEARRWELWQQLYGFAAVPPTPEGQQMARKILDEAWPKYSATLPKIEKGKANLQPPPIEILKKVAALLQADVPVRAKLLLFVGGFNGVPEKR